MQNELNVTIIIINYMMLLAILYWLQLSYLTPDQ